LKTDSGYPICCGVLLELIGLQFECVAEYCSLLHSTFKVYFCVANQKTKCVAVCCSLSVCVYLMYLKQRVLQCVLQCVLHCVRVLQCVLQCVRVTDVSNPARDYPPPHARS